MSTFTTLFYTSNNEVIYLDRHIAKLTKLTKLTKAQRTAVEFTDIKFSQSDNSVTDHTTGVRKELPWPITFAEVAAYVDTL